MTDYKLPVLRRLSADEVVPGMTIAGKVGDLIVIGKADHCLGTGIWYTEDGFLLGYGKGHYDLLAEAPPITLPQEMGAVIRYFNGEFTEIAHRVTTLSRAWRVDGFEESFSDEDILARLPSESYEIATWTKPGDQK
ncbi:hypothetical protein [Arthrobacter russicus]|uniref:Uncharacterized protein n=1 Tax=Arthrobacter russicus TaxID=172040 RepID=A0ABU1JE13_9MICC|nr:hypothetical protein [Arthrobacter russicus]MDR6270615.1 hypothetical protein [Arthrobacter russicus]